MATPRRHTRTSGSAVSGSSRTSELSRDTPIPDEDLQPAKLLLSNGSVYREAELKVIPPHGIGSDARGITYPAFQGPPKYMRIMELLFSDARTPWKTLSDVQRAFIDLGCHVFGLALGGTIMSGLLHNLDMMNELVGRAREANDLAQSMEHLSTEVKRLEDGEMRESAVGLVYHYREAAKQIADKVLRRRLVGEINKRFGYLLKGAQGRKVSEIAGGGTGTRIEVDPEHHEDDDTNTDIDAEEGDW